MNLKQKSRVRVIRLPKRKKTISGESKTLVVVPVIKKKIAKSGLHNSIKELVCERSRLEREYDNVKKRIIEAKHNLSKKIGSLEKEHFRYWLKKFESSLKLVKSDMKKVNVLLSKNYK